MKKLCVFYLVVLLFFCGAKKSLCGDSEDDEHISAIQDRIYHRYHELNLSIGYIPDDDFFYLYPVGLSYSFNFNDYLSWEVVRGLFVMNQEKDLKKNLETECGVTPKEFDKPEYMLHSHLVVRPLYGKAALWNTGIINRESYFFLGGGMVNYETEYSYGEPDSKNVPSLSFGIGTKYFLNEHISLNFEIRDIVNFKEDETVNNIMFGIGLGFRFNLTARKADKDVTIEKLEKYLRDDENE